MRSGQPTAAASRRSTAHLPESWDEKIGLRATFYATTPDAIRARCDPLRLAELAEEIGRANAGL